MQVTCLLCAKDIVSLVEWATAELLQRQPADPLGFLQKLVTRAVQTVRVNACGAYI